MGHAKNSIIILLITVLMTISSYVYATSWVKLEPEEVVDKSQIVVTGKYRIPDMNRFRQKDMWIPFEFTVEKYYKGSGRQLIQVAIEQYDIGWSKKFQNEEGSFLLFLYKDKEDFWIPVGGPNGMIQILNREIINRSPDEVKYYKNYLSKLNPKMPEKDSNHENNKWLLLIIGISLVIVVSVVLKRLKH